MPPTHTSPVATLREDYHAESYWADDYLTGAAPILAGLGFLNRPVTDHDRAVAGKVLDALRDTDLDVTDVFPFGTVWALLIRPKGSIGLQPEHLDQIETFAREANTVG